MKRLLAALLLVASPALAQSNGWQEIQNGWGEIQTATGGSSTPATCVSAGQIPFLGTPTTLGMGCDAGLKYDAGTGTLTLAAAGKLNFSTDSGLSRYYAGALKITDGSTGFGQVFAGGFNLPPSGGEVKGYHVTNYPTFRMIGSGTGSLIVGSDFVYSWKSITDADNGTPDTGLRRVSAGLVGVTDGSTGNGALQTGGVQYVTGSRPTCDAAARGMTWYVAGGAGVADTFEVCRKDNLDAYAWVSLF